MWPIAVLVIYSVCVILASLLGGSLPSLLRLTHTRSQLLISFVASLMLGVAMFHLLPHAVVETQSVDRAVWWAMVGLVATFFLIRVFHHHHHEPVTIDSEGEQAHHHEHDHGHDHDHDEAHAALPGQPDRQNMSWIGIAIGLSLHTLMDGIALAAGVRADIDAGATGLLLGFGTFLAVVLHKPLDAMSITSVMAVTGWSQAWRQRVNLGFALMCPLGAAVFCLGVHYFVEQERVIVGCALGFSAGVFLCIALGDLLPEVQFHSHDRLKLSLTMLVGIAAAYGIGFLEPEHRHSFSGDQHAAPDHSHGHDHDGHDHDGHDHPPHKH